MKSPELECRFCRIGAGHAHFDHDRIVMESEDYFAIASIGGFVEGWTLVCPKRHILNFSSDYREDAFVSFTMEVANTVSSAYGSVVVFEHGVREHGSLTGCGTNHAHLHLVPFQGSFVQCVQSDQRERMWVRGAAKDVQKSTGGCEYLLMADSPEALAEDAYVSIVDHPQSQFFRKILASHVGMEGQADYRSFPFQAKAVLTAQRIAGIVEERSAVAMA